MTIALPGERVALALADMDVGDVGRGSVIIGNVQTLTPTSRIEVELRITSDEIEVGPRTRVRFHLGTSDVGARISRLETADPPDQKRQIGVIVLDEPLFVRTLDRFVLRLPSPPQTIGGGVVRDPFPAGGRRKSRATVGESSRDLLARIALDAGEQGLDEAILPIRLGVTSTHAEALVKAVGLTTIQSRVYESGVLDGHRKGHRAACS